MSEQPEKVLVDLGWHGVRRGEVWAPTEPGRVRVMVYGDGLWQVDPRAVELIPGTERERVETR